MAVSDYYTYGTNLRNKEFFTSTVNTKNGIKRYFSNIDADIYFGNKLVEDIVEFQFSVEEQKLPIFSYNKFYADIIVPGQRIVQGTFIINFTDGKYMSELLSEIDDSIYNSSYFDEELYNPAGSPKNRALYNKNFDISLCYGDYKSDNPTYNATIHTLGGVQIQSLGVAVSAKTGEPILEVYSFIAKDFIDDEASSFISPDEENKKDDENSNNENDKGNNKEEDETYQVQYGQDYGKQFYTIYAKMGISKNTKTSSSKISEKALLTITDKNVIDFEAKGTTATDFSKVTTMTRDKVSLKEERYVGYIVDIDSNHTARPIHIKLIAYFKKNPKKKVKATMEYEINGKKLNKDVSIEYSTDGLTIK